MSGADFVKAICDTYMESEDYKSGTYKSQKYQGCCVQLDYCSFYWRSWFWYTCGGVILLLIIASIVGSVFCCCRRGRGGGGHDEDASEISDSTKNSMDI